MRRRLTISKRNENAKRRNANQDNLLQQEMDRFEKQHNREMKSILQERQMAQEAMSDIRRHRASSSLAARMVLHDNAILNDRVNSFPTLSEKSYSENKQTQISGDWQSSSETHGATSVGKPCLMRGMEGITRSPNALRRKCSENFNIALLPSRNDMLGRSRARAPTYPEGTRSDVFGLSRRRAHTISEGTRNIPSDSDKYSSSSTTMRHQITLYGNVTNRWVHPSMEDSPIRLRDEGEDLEENRPRSRSDPSFLLIRKPTSISLGKSLLTESYSKVPTSRDTCSPLLPRRSSADSNRLSSLRRGAFEFSSVNAALQPSKLSPSRNIAKFRQTGTAAAAAQTLVSRYQRDKAISKATENLIVERAKREETRQHREMKTGLKTDKASRLRERFFTIAQLITALNKLKMAAAASRTPFSQELD